MILTREEFAREAESLVNALEAYRCDSQESSSNTAALTQWAAAMDDSIKDGFYLEHPPVTRYLPCSPAVVEDLDLLEDETVELDTDAAATTPSMPGTEWRFSIVYSDTWRVPVLYFSVQFLDGTPCVRSQVTKMFPKDETIEDTWDFVSQEEHPVTGVPSFFLHPCQTAERLELLQAGADTGADNIERSNLLLSWMSMILPAVGFSIPPKTFMHVRDLMNESTAKSLQKGYTS